MNSEHTEINDKNRLGNDCLPIVEDSGTESGEDLRLLAAGLQSNLNKMDQDQQQQQQNHEQSQNTLVKSKSDVLCAGLLLEVTSALERLQCSLNQGEIDLDDSRKATLLNLVNRLQRGLISPEKIPENEVVCNFKTKNVLGPMEIPEYNDMRRGSSGSGVSRFAKRKNRNSRHTVGVTREELADARRIIEELEIIGMQNTVSKPKVTAKVVNSTPGIYNAILTRQFSEPITLLRPSQFVPKETLHNEYPNKSKYKVHLKQSISLDQPASILKNNAKQEMIPKVEAPKFVPKKIALQRNTSGSNNIFTMNNKLTDDEPSDESSSSDDEDEMENTKFYNNNNSNKFNAKENYLRNQHASDKSFNYSSGDEANSSSTRQPKYTSKKMKMKRANTIDLPKSFSFVNTFDISDKDNSDSETMKNTYQNRSMNAGLKTTITGGSSVTNHVAPQFTPKTENDKKFLAFIQKQNNVVPSWTNPTGDRAVKTQNWINKFGNLKNKFESDVQSPESSVSPQKNFTNAAASFWKNIEKEKPSARVSPLPPAMPIKVSQPLMKNLPIASEKFPWKNSANDKIIKIDEPVIIRKKIILDKFIPNEQAPAEVPRVIMEPNKLPVLKPTNVNNFSHAPLSAFKPPISRKLSNSFKPLHNNDDILKKPLPQVSNGIVKQMAETGYNVNNYNPLPQQRKFISSPTRSIADLSFGKIKKSPEKLEPVPWAGRPKSERVLNIAASKFEHVPTVHLATHLQDPSQETIVKYRNNPLYNGTPDKRASLPPNTSLYRSFDASAFSANTNVSSHPQPFTNAISAPKETTFVITDFTHPTFVSTYSPEAPIAKPSLNRQDSLTNPDQEPIVLTCTRTVFSPKEKSKPLERFDAHTPVSSQLSNDNSLTSICDDLEHELDDLSESIECKVAISKVMKAPVVQTAYTQSSELTCLSDQGKENAMVKSLQDSLKKFAQKSPTPEHRPIDLKRLSQESSNSSLDIKMQTLKMPLHSESRLSQDSSSSSIDSKLPIFKIPVPAVPETAYSFTYPSPPKIQVKSPSIGPSPHVLYNNISQNPAIQRTKSSHMLSIPKPSDPPAIPQTMYGVPPNILMEKQKTMTAYFGPDKRSDVYTVPHVRPVTFSTQSSVARKTSLYVKPTAPKVVVHQPPKISLSRSKTMPSLAKVKLLDESNIDDAFEELLSSANL